MLPNCLDCKIKLKNRRSKRCRRCANLGKRNPAYGKKRSLKARTLTSKANKGNPICGAWIKGKKHKLSTRLKMSRAQKKKIKEGKHNWQDKIGKNTYKKRRNYMKDIKYKLWRTKVFERDNYFCIRCKKKNIYIHADHILSWAHYPQLRYNINNGRTLCMKCHFYITYNKQLPDGVLWGHTFQVVEGGEYYS